MTLNNRKKVENNPTIGDVFEIDLQNGRKKYIQYIGSDLTQLNSDVVRVFGRDYPIEKEVNIEDVVNDEVEFYSHITGMEFGEKDGSWIKKGNNKNLGDLEKAFFRQSDDYGNSEIKVSKKWSVWHMNEPMVYVGELLGKNTKAHIGSVTWPKTLVQDLRTGKRSFFYPGY